MGPKLRKLLWGLSLLFALLGANSLYLVTITTLEWLSARRGEGVTYQNYFYELMFLLHVALGLSLIVPLGIFVGAHLWSTRHRANRRAVRMGYVLLAACTVLVVSGLVLLRIVGVFEVKSPELRAVFYWLHVAAPLVAMWAYVLHRLAGPRIRWRAALGYLGVVGAVVLGMVLLHSHDPRRWDVAGPKRGQKYFLPSLARTATGGFIPAKVMMMDHYCRECHADIYDGWLHSAHRMSSFNNPAYHFSVSEARQVVLERDGNRRAARWCSGCHDPVPFFSGALEREDYDLKHDPTASAGITCTVCHSITHVNSTRGNADYTIEEPVLYPFTFSENPALAVINRQLIKAKPALHKQTFLKPLHKTAEFCSACHKVHLPYELTHYKEFLRGQNQYDSFVLSSSGHGSRSFYYPQRAEENCNGCHMPAKASNDFAARRLPELDGLGIHDHFFPGANTAVMHWKHEPEQVAAEQAILRDCVRVDIFGIKQGSTVDAPLVAPLRPELPRLAPGKSYLIETVIRALTVGHNFTEGTVDSNQVWVEMTARMGDRVIGKSGGMDDDGKVDPWSHFVNVYLLDRYGNRIDRRNDQDIFTPLYDNQIPPNAARVVHFRLDVPPRADQPITLEVRVNYRKFDTNYLRMVFGKQYHNDLPVTTLAGDSVTLPVGEADVAAAPDERLHEQRSRIAAWQRWNDYGISMLLEGAMTQLGELRGAEEAFTHVRDMQRSEGALNLARVYFRTGFLDRAAAALRQAESMQPPPPAWTIAWFDGQIHKQRGDLESAAAAFRSILDGSDEQRRRRNLDFSKDYIVINELGLTYFEWAKLAQSRGDDQAYVERLRKAVAAFKRTLMVDSENLAAHYNLSLLYERLGQDELAKQHAALHERYRPDDNAEQLAVDVARRRDAAANHASEATVIYSLQREEAPGLPALSGDD